MDDQRLTHPPVPGRPTYEAGDVRRAWERVTAWLEQHAPDAFAALGGPGSRSAISGAEQRMGVKLPGEMWQWLLANDIDAGRRPDARPSPVALGRDIVLPGGRLVLGLTDIERVHLHMTATEESEPSGDPACPSWRREWVPIVAGSDAHHGEFVNTRTGTVGTWSEGAYPQDGEFPSLSAFFQEMADQLEGVSTGEWSGAARARRLTPRPEDEPVRRWARANGYLVHDRGRVPASIREAYEASW